MIVNAKMLNGDLISIEMNVYSQQAVCDSLRSYEYNGFIKIQDLQEYENGDKDVFVIVLPVHQYACEFLAFMEHFRINSFGYPNADMRDWANECKAHASGYEPIIQYFEDPYEYCEQIKLFIPLLTGDSFVSENKTALEAVTDIFLDAGNELGADPTSSTSMIFYNHLCKTSSGQIDNIYHRLVEHFTNIDRSLHCIEDHLWSTCGNVPALIRVIRDIRPDLFEETFHGVTVLTAEDREAVYDLSPVDITKEKLLSILRYDITTITTY